MSLSKVLLKVSPADDISQTVIKDVTAEVLATGKVVYDVGVPNAKRWYFVVLINDAGNTSVRELGSFTTAPSYVMAINVPMSGDAVAGVEANFNSPTYGRLGVTADTVSFDGSGGLRVNPPLAKRYGCRGATSVLWRTLPASVWTTTSPISAATGG